MEKEGSKCICEIDAPIVVPYVSNWVTVLSFHPAEGKHWVLVKARECEMRWDEISVLWVLREVSVEVVMLFNCVGSAVMFVQKGRMI